MSASIYSVSDIMKRLSRHDPTLKDIRLYGNYHTDAELAELADCLLAHPDVVTRAWLDRKKLTDETGVKLAQYLAASSTIEFLDLRHNRLGSATHLALAAALRVNSSLWGLHLSNNQAVERARVDAAFVEALRLNTDRPAESRWWLYKNETDDFKRLRTAADQLGHPSLQTLLVHKALISSLAESPDKHSDHQSCQVA